MKKATAAAALIAAVTACSLLCADAQYVVCAVNSDYDESDPLYKAEGISASTDRLVVINAQDGSVVSDRSLAHNQYCSDAVLFRDGIMCVVITLEEDTADCVYECIYCAFDGETSVLNGKCTSIGGLEPELSCSGSDVTARFYDPETLDFGLTRISGELEVSTLLEHTDGAKYDVQSGALVSGGEKTVYYYACDGAGVYAVCSAQDGITEFSLPDGYRVRSFAPLEDSVLFSAEKENAGSAVLLEVDLDGNILSETECIALFRMQSDGTSRAMAIDMDYNVYAICSAGTLTAEKFSRPIRSWMDGRCCLPATAADFI